MKHTLKYFCIVMMTMATCWSFVSCSDDDEDDATKSISLEGKWVCMSQDFKELMIVGADNSVTTSKAEGDEIWANVKGNITTDGETFYITYENDVNLNGTFTLNNNKLTLTTEKGVYSYNKLTESFSMVGEWEVTNTMCFCHAIKDEIELPSGSIVNGEEIPISIKTENVNGKFIEGAIKTYFNNINFKDDSTLEYTVIKNEENVAMSKNYQIANNIIKVTGKTGSIDIENSFMVFRNEETGKAFMFMTKQNVADMFFAYGLMLREGGISEGTNESLEGFKESFISAFDNFAIILTLEMKQ